MIVVSLTGWLAAAVATALAVFAVEVGVGSILTSFLLVLLLDCLYRSYHVSCMTSSGRPGTWPVGLGSKREGRRNGGGGSDNVDLDWRCA